MNAFPESERRSRAHDPEGRRRDVLAAARRLFAAKGYAQTSIRAIAAAADVNQALVITYFGGKQALFMEAVGRFEIPRDALTGGPGGPGSPGGSGAPGGSGGSGSLGARLARAYVGRWENLADDDPWPALVRSAVSDEASRQLLRSALETQLAVPLGEVLGENGDGPVRNAMVQCLIGGMIMERYIYALEPACSLPAAAFEAALAGLLQHAITGPLTVGDRAGDQGAATS